MGRSTVARSRVRAERLAGFLEAAYDLEADNQTWLQAVMNAALAMCEWGVASHGALYDASEGTFRPENVAIIGMSDAATDHVVRGIDLVTPPFVMRLFRSLLANATRDLELPEMRPMFDGLAACGFVDAFHINGLDPSGRSTYFALWADHPIAVSRAERDLFRRMAHHLAAAQRVRRRLRASQPDASKPDPTQGAEAILDARRRVVHAEGPARPKAAREDLIAAAAARDQARRSCAEPGDTLLAWRPLTRARWTLVDSFEQGGARYVVARENQSCFDGLESLTDRERQAVVYLALGQSTKEAAYALGISDATVRVLVARAASKLGVRSRAGLLAHPGVRQFSPGEKA